MIDFKNPGISGVSAGIIAIIVSYINNKMTKNKSENIHYFKLFTLVFIIVYTIVYVNNQSGGKYSGGGSIHTGTPNF